MIAVDFQPFSVVEDCGFKDLVNYLEPKYKIPSRQTFSRRIIPEMFEEKRTKIKNVIDQDYNNLESLSITADLWSSRAKDSYISCTGHYIDANFVFKHFTLACSPFPGEHSGESILNKLNSILTDWGI